jgi:hypothetical protein
MRRTREGKEEEGGGGGGGGGGSGRARSELGTWDLNSRSFSQGGSSNAAPKLSHFLKSFQPGKGFFSALEVFQLLLAVFPVQSSFLESVRTSNSGWCFFFENIRRCLFQLPRSSLLIRGGGCVLKSFEFDTCFRGKKKKYMQM